MRLTKPIKDNMLEADHALGYVLIELEKQKADRAAGIVRKVRDELDALMREFQCEKINRSRKDFSDENEQPGHKE